MRCRLALLLVVTFGCGSTDEAMFSDLRIEEIGENGAMFRFRTRIETTCEAQFGQAPDALDRSAIDPSMDADNPYALDHSVPLGGLMPGTRYYVVAMAEDRAGESYESSALSFDTLAADESTELVNVALINAGSRVASVSSNWMLGDNNSSFGANNAIDGSMSTQWSSNGDGDEAFIEVEFADIATLVELRFRSREMTDGSSIIRGIELTTESGQRFGPYLTPDPARLYSIAFDPPIQARRVRIDATETSGGNTGAREIQFLARR